VNEKQRVYCSDGSQAVPARPSDNGGLDALKSKISLELHMKNQYVTL
jgi:hypothetical protein